MAELAGGLSGALRGMEAIASQWIVTVEKGILDDPCTVSRRTARQSAKGLNQACINEMQRIKWSDLPEIGTQCLVMFQEAPLQCGINNIEEDLNENRRLKPDPHKLRKQMAKT